AAPPPAVDTLTLGACRDDETAADAKFDGRYAGAFTHGLLTALRESPDATWTQVFERLKREVRRGGFDQTPEIHGASALRDAPIFGGRASRARAVSSPSPAFDLAAHDRRIVQAETTGQWAEAARLLEERGARVTTDDERAYTYEHLVTLCRVKLHDERRAVAAAENLLAAAPAHADARRYLRAAYQSSGDVAKMRALDASQPREGGDLLGVLGAVASAVGQMMATPPAHGGAAKASPRATSGARCGYCGATVSAGAGQCPSCGAGA
ncbi:MAG: zinc ribbon domain-containing protein, partial [Polyangiales bacterium]